MASSPQCLPGSETLCMQRNSTYGTWEVLLGPFNRKEPVSQAHKVSDRDEQEVGWTRSTGEAGEQRLDRGGGVSGGKGANQEQQPTMRPRPDTALENWAVTPAGCTSTRTEEQEANIQ